MLLNQRQRLSNQTDSLAFQYGIRGHPRVSGVSLLAAELMARYSGSVRPFACAKPATLHVQSTALRLIHRFYSCYAVSRLFGAQATRGSLRAAAAGCSCWFVYSAASVCDSTILHLFQSCFCLAALVVRCVGLCPSKVRQGCCDSTSVRGVCTPSIRCADPPTSLFRIYVI